MRLVVLLLLWMPACANKERTPDGGAMVQGAPAAATKTPRCVEDPSKRTAAGKLSGCLLAADWATETLTCKQGHVVDLYPNGTLKRCSLAGRTALGGFLCMETTELYDDGKFKRCKLASAKNVNGVDVRAGDSVTAYRSGALKRVEFGSGAGKLKGLPCKGLFNFFHENGHLKKCEIAEATAIDGQEASAGALVCFDDRGKRVRDCAMLSWEMLD